MVSHQDVEKLAAQIFVQLMNNFHWEYSSEQDCWMVSTPLSKEIAEYAFESAIAFCEESSRRLNEKLKS